MAAWERAFCKAIWEKKSFLIFLNSFCPLPGVLFVFNIVCVVVIVLVLLVIVMLHVLLPSCWLLFGFVAGGI